MRITAFLGRNQDSHDMERLGYDIASVFLLNGSGIVYCPYGPVAHRFAELQELPGSDVVVFFDPFNTCPAMAERSKELAKANPQIEMFYVDGGDSGFWTERRPDNLHAIAYETTFQSVAQQMKAIYLRRLPEKVTASFNLSDAESVMHNRVITPID